MIKKNFFKLCLKVLIFISAINLLYAQAQPPSRGVGVNLYALIIMLLLWVFFAAIGLTIIASGQVFLAIREIAINTRKEESKETSQYRALLTIAKLNNIIGWIIIISGIFFAITIRSLLPI